MIARHFLIHLVAISLITGIVYAQERAPRRDLRGAQRAEVEINLNKLVKKRRSDAFKYIYISRQRTSDFDLGQGGISHQKWEDVWIVPLRYEGEDDENFIFVEQIQNEPWRWAFAKRSTGTRSQITYLPFGESDWKLFDDSAIQERRFQPN